MDEMPSAEFRRTYAKIRRPTTVTVNGHPIGEWHPAKVDPLYVAEQLGAAAREGVRILRDGPTPAQVDDAFNRRPFTPVPKKGK